MAPAVFHRVCNGTPSPAAWQKDRVSIQPALLRGYRRHKVRYADFPAIVTAGSPEQTVRGTLVAGLTDADIFRLDIFEGSMYERVVVDVQIKSGLQDDYQDDNFKGDIVEAQTYVWIQKSEELEPGEWNFEEFVRDKLSIWAGSSGKEDFEGQGHLTKFAIKQSLADILKKLIEQ